MRVHVDIAYKHYDAYSWTDCKPNEQIAQGNALGKRTIIQHALKGQKQIFSNTPFYLLLSFGMTLMCLLSNHQFSTR